MNMQMMIDTARALVADDKGLLAAQETLDQVADATLHCLLRTIPAAVPGIAFLSGGRSAQLAAARMNATHVRWQGGSQSGLPWAVSFSFSRALQQPALDIWRGSESNVSAAQQALQHCAACNWQRDEVSMTPRPTMQYKLDKIVCNGKAPRQWWDTLTKCAGSDRQEKSEVQED